MIFTQDFTKDLRAIDFTARKPWALVRFGDGEHAILTERRCRTADRWNVPALQSGFSKQLRVAFDYDDPDWHVGISCPCCDPVGHEWYRKHSPVPIERMTYSNLFVNANLSSAVSLVSMLCGKFALVTSATGEHAENLADRVYHVPTNAVNGEWNIDGLVGQLCRQFMPILVAAGPASEIIIHRYWTQCKPESRQVIADIGSILDPILHGQRTRGYHDPECSSRKRICYWR